MRWAGWGSGELSFLRPARRWLRGCQQQGREAAVGSSVPASESDSGGRRQNTEWLVLGSSLILTKGWEMMAHPSRSLLVGP